MFRQLEGIEAMHSWVMNSSRGLIAMFVNARASCSELRAEEAAIDVDMSNRLRWQTGTV